MSLNRREFLYLISVLGLGGSSLFAKSHQKTYEINTLEDYYKLENFGSARFLHMTDSHAQLMPVYFREPSVNLGLHSNYGKPPHIVGAHFLKHYGIKAGSRMAYALSCMQFDTGAKQFNRVGGFAQIKTLVDTLRGHYGHEKTLFFDGGDTWQGSWTALKTRGKDMIEALNLLGVDVCTAHWEFTYTQTEILENLTHLKADFVAQNVYVTEEAMMGESKMNLDSDSIFDEDSGRMFQPYVMKTVGKHRIAVIGQAFPFTPIANPKRFIPDWTFGIRPEEMQELVDEITETQKPDAIICISHNGYDVDKKMASMVSGIDFIMGGHTHDGVPEAYPVKNPKGTTHVINSGSNGKFISVLDLDIQHHKVIDFRYTLLPVFSDLIPEDKTMQHYIQTVRAPYEKTLSRKLATSEETLYRRGNFNGTFDQIICDALIEVKGADISLSPGFRWGVSVPAGHDITFEDVTTHTAMTYPETYLNELTGQQLHAILEDVADNLFHSDPFYQQGGDMVRTGGLSYTFDPTASKGRRISNLKLSKNGKILESNKIYKVAGWSSVADTPPEGEPIWETVETYLKARTHIKHIHLETPDLINIQGNPGIQQDLYRFRS
jgi:S-sulfosulfanyl-L-cysteine sulfohydrolase